MTRDELLHEASYWQRTAARDYGMVEDIRACLYVGDIVAWQKLGAAATEYAMEHLFRAMGMEA